MKIGEFLGVGRLAWHRPRRTRRGQALTEFALVFPIFLIVIMSMIVIGLYVFFNQQLANAAREAARYAAVTGSGAQCPTVSRLDPAPGNQFSSYKRCDAPENGWPRMTDAARSKVFGMAANQVYVRACWSGYTDSSYNYDLQPTDPGASYTNCTIGGIDPRTNPDAISCPPPAQVLSIYVPPMADGDDKASDLAHAPGPTPAPSSGATPNPGAHFATTVTVFTCYQWAPPLAGFVFIPAQITLRAVVTEAIQRQQ